MPEDIKPPKTIAEMGIHMVYMSKAITAMQKTLEDMRDGSISRAEFDDHVVWGETIAKDHEKRISVLERSKLVEDNSLRHKVFKMLDDKLALVITILVIAMFIYMAYKLNQPPLDEVVQII